MKILHLPNNIAGVPWALAEAERARGHDSRVITFEDNPFGFKADEVLIAGKASKLELFAKAFAAFMRNRTGYDVYHFNFGGSLLHAPGFGLTLADLPFYDRSARKVFTFSGCDARQKYPTLDRVAKTGANAACHNPDCYGGMCNSGVRDRQRRAAIDKAAKYADHFFALNPDLLHFLPAEMSSFCPYVIADFENLPSKQNPFFENDQVHFVHAPTDRAAKGTDAILEAVERLQSSYPGRVKLTLVEHCRREEALEIYRSADMLIDQVMIGWYGGVAVEAMKMGVPVASYVEDSDLHLIPEQMNRDMAIYRVQESTLYEQLETLVKSREMIEELAPKSVAYVDRWHNPVTISGQILDVYAA